MLDENSRVVGSAFNQDDVETEFTLRPKWMKEYIGQDKAKKVSSTFTRLKTNSKFRVIYQGG